MSAYDERDELLRGMRERQEYRELSARKVVPWEDDPLGLPVEDDEWDGTERRFADRRGLERGRREDD